MIADRLADCRRSSSERSPGPLSVPTFVDLALDEGKIVGYCAWTCEPFGETCEQCIHVMNLGGNPSNPVPGMGTCLNLEFVVSLVEVICCVYIYTRKLSFGFCHVFVCLQQFGL